MSLGLLRGLAARALGLETPLRSQRVQGGANTAEPNLGGEPAPWEALPQVDDRRPATAPPHAPRDREEPRPTALGASASEHPPAATQLFAKHPQADHAARIGSVRTAPAAVDARLATTQAPHRAAADAAAATVPAQREARASPPAAAVTPTAPIAPTSRMVQDVQHAVPAPLLPLSTPPALPPPLAMNAASPGRRADRHRQAAAEAPTEVHVSIGRVDLTALAPTAAARPPARRDVAAGRSLADYLRGTAGKRPP